MNNKCNICTWILELKDSPFLIKEFSTGYAVVSKYQYNPGYVLFLHKKHLTELHELTETESKTFLYEMSIVAKAVYKTVRPDKLNYELLGNTEPHLHWHLIPRYKGEKNYRGPVWVVSKKIRYAKKYTIGDEQATKLRNEVLKNLG